MKNLFLTMAAVTAAFLTTPVKAETTDCTEIASVPFVITVQGVYCLKSDKSSNLTSGNMIDIQTNNVTIDLNGFKLGGLGAGLGTSAIGIHADGRQNTTIRNGSIRGFAKGVSLTGSSSGNLIEDILFDGNRQVGIEMGGSNGLIRNNRIVNTGPSNNTVAAFGIILFAADRTVVADNIISGTSESDVSNGIVVVTSSLIELRNNTILDTKDAVATRAISMDNSTAVTVIGNRILNVPTSGDVGVVDLAGSVGVNCIDNTVAGFATALIGCDFAINNNLP